MDEDYVTNVEGTVSSCHATSEIETNVSSGDKSDSPGKNGAQNDDSEDSSSNSSDTGSASPCNNNTADEDNLENKDCAINDSDTEKNGSNSSDTSSASPCNNNTADEDNLETKDGATNDSDAEENGSNSSENSGTSPRNNNTADKESLEAKGGITNDSLQNGDLEEPFSRDPSDEDDVISKVIVSLGADESDDKNDTAANSASEENADNAKGDIPDENKSSASENSDNECGSDNKQRELKMVELRITLERVNLEDFKHLLVNSEPLLVSSERPAKKRKVARQLSSSEKENSKKRVRFAKNSQKSIETSSDDETPASKAKSEAFTNQKSTDHDSNVEEKRGSKRTRRRLIKGHNTGANEGKSDVSENDSSDTNKTPRGSRNNDTEKKRGSKRTRGGLIKDHNAGKGDVSEDDSSDTSKTRNDGTEKKRGSKRTRLGLIKNHSTGKSDVPEDDSSDTSKTPRCSRNDSVEKKRGLKHTRGGLIEDHSTDKSDVPEDDSSDISKTPRGSGNDCIEKKRGSKRTRGGLIEDYNTGANEGKSDVSGNDSDTSKTSKGSKNDSTTGDEKDESPERSKISTKNYKIRARRPSSSSKQDDDNDPSLIKIKKLIKIANLRIHNYNEFWSGCTTSKAKKQRVIEFLREKGLKGTPSYANCRKLAKKLEREKEISELDTGNIIERPESTPARPSDHEEPTVNGGELLPTYSDVMANIDLLSTYIRKQSFPAVDTRFVNRLSEIIKNNVKKQDAINSVNSIVRYLQLSGLGSSEDIGKLRDLEKNIRHKT